MDNKEPFSLEATNELLEQSDLMVSLSCEYGRCQVESKKVAEEAGRYGVPVPSNYAVMLLEKLIEQLIGERTLLEIRIATEKKFVEDGKQIIANIRKAQLLQGPGTSPNSFPR